MKLDEDHCWYNGRHELCKELYPGRYEWCSSEYHRCVECLENEHCPSYKPWCDWDLECEECLVNAHCDHGEECLLTGGALKCRRIDCVDLLEEGFPDYCKDRYPSTPVCDVARRKCVECVDLFDCADGEVCVDSKCIKGEDRDCVEHGEAGMLDYCERLFPDRPVCHAFLRECVECQFDVHCSAEEVCAGTRCIPKEWECERSEDCLSNRFKCVEHECVKKVCSDYDDPDAFCDETQAGWRCYEGECVRCIEDEDCHEGQHCVKNKCVSKLCSEYKQPDRWCRDKYGHGWECIDGECVNTLPDLRKCSEFLSTEKADEFCKNKDPATPHCNFETARCEECVYLQHCPPHWLCWNYICRECLSDEYCHHLEPFGTWRCTGDPDWKCVKSKCGDAEDPDRYCVEKYGEGYKCIAGECELVGCDGEDSRCPDGYYCPKNECVWGCRNHDNCPEITPWCSKLTGKCEECLVPEHCGQGYACKDNICIKGVDCLKDDGLCEKNEYCNVDVCEEGCRDSRNCGEETLHCSQKTGKCEECVYDLHCDAGYDCEGYRCVWVGHECGNDSECPVNWMCHDQRYECIYGCKNDDNCSKQTPHCSQKTGKCEECVGDVHCEDGAYQVCEDFRCIARRGFEECSEEDKKSGFRCREGIWVRIECKSSDDCMGYEECMGGICVDKERDCKSDDECPYGYYCDLEKTYRCQEQECRSHEDCPPGQGCDFIEYPAKIRDRRKSRCISWREYQCSDEDPCPDPWICDRGTSLCVERLCDVDEDCFDGYKCEDNLCLEKNCGDMADPLAFCMESRGWYYRCDNGVCVLLPCYSYDDPDMMCMDTKGASYRCVDVKCVDFGVAGGESPTGYCADQLGVDEAYWDYDSESCKVPDCDTVWNPDTLCAQLKGPSYRCREGECRHGREGEDCRGSDDCVRGLRCKEGICIKKECINWRDCNMDTEWCDGDVCVPMNKSCVSDAQCREDFHCDPAGLCVPDDCSDHYDCGLGYCCDDSGVCIPCGDLTCFWNFDCRRGWRCDPKVNKCVRGGCKRGSDCDPGYYCDLDTGECKLLEVAEGCKDDSDCPPGQVCVGYDVYAELDFFTIIKKPVVRLGTCVDPGEQVIAIKGTDDEETCDYCRFMWTKTGKEGEYPLPPYHERCRCYGVYEG